MRHRRPSLKACSNGGLEATVSAFALMGFGPLSGSLAHEGTNPHLSFASPRVFPSGFSPMTATSCAGATLYRGVVAGFSGRPNVLTRSSGETERVYRPHMHEYLGGRRHPG